MIYKREHVSLKDVFLQCVKICEKYLLRVNTTRSQVVNSTFRIFHSSPSKDQVQVKSMYRLI